MLNKFKLSFIAMSSFLPLTLFLPVAAKAETSQIEQVTIYQGIASVTRSIKVDANKGNSQGEQVVVFSCLSPYMDVNSLDIQASEGMNLGEVHIEDIKGEALQQCHYQNDSEQSRTHQDKLDQINAELDAAKLAIAYLNNLTKVSQINNDGSAGHNAKTIAKEATRLNKRIIELQQQQSQTQEALKKLTAGNHNVTTESVKQVSVRTASHQDGEVRLQYHVRGAGWEPKYQARLNTDTEQLTITASAVIAQATGESWLNIPLTLSPVNPDQKAASWLPTANRFKLIDKPKEDVGSMPAPVIVMDQEESSYYSKEGIALPEPSRGLPALPSFTVSSSNMHGLTTYQLPQRITIPNDGSHIQTVIGEQSGNTQIWIRSAPSKETKAYWYAAAPFLTPAWADGSMQLYRDDNYIGQSYYAYQKLTEQGIGFGIDNNLIVKQLSKERQAGDSGRPKADADPKTKYFTFNESYEFTNLHNRPIKLEVLGSEPISLDDNIKTTITHTPPVTEHDWNHEQGIVSWEFNMAPKQTQTVKTEYSLSYPGDKELY